LVILFFFGTNIWLWSSLNQFKKTLYMFENPRASFHISIFACLCSKIYASTTFILYSFFSQADRRHSQNSFFIIKEFFSYPLALLNGKYTSRVMFFFYIFTIYDSRGLLFPLYKRDSDFPYDIYLASYLIFDIIIQVRCMHRAFPLPIHKCWLRFFNGPLILTRSFPQIPTHTLWSNSLELDNFPLGSIQSMRSCSKPKQRASWDWLFGILVFVCLTCGGTRTFQSGIVTLKGL